MAVNSKTLVSEDMQGRLDFYGHEILEFQSLAIQKFDVIENQNISEYTCIRMLESSPPIQGIEINHFCDLDIFQPQSLGIHEFEVIAFLGLQ